MHREKLYETLEFLLKSFEGDEGYFLLSHELNNLTRFANSQIHQNTSLDSVKIAISVAYDGKIGTYSTTSLDKEILKESLLRAKKIALNSPKNPEFSGFATSGELKQEDTFYEETYHFSEKGRREVVAQIVKILSDAKGYGIVSTGGSEILIGTTGGCRAYLRQSDAHLTVTAFKDGSSGWAEEHSRKVDEINPKKTAKRALQKAEIHNKGEIPPGEYSCILESPAVADILTFMGFIGFSAKTYEEKRSFLLNKLGKKVFSEKLSVIDDPFNPQGFNFSFDFEGTTRKKVSLIEKGVAKSLVYDTRTAKKMGTESTGNGMGIPPSTFPFPGSPYIEKGEHSLDSIIRETDRALYITRFHYTNIVEPINFVLTGMTRDGTFLVENGKIIKGVKNLRFTDSFIRVLNDIEEISSETALIGGDTYGFRFPIGAVVPAIKVKGIRFTSGTQF